MVPADFRVVRASSDSITVGWHPISEDGTLVIVERRNADNEPWIRRDTQRASAGSFIDRSVRYGQEYQYRIQFENSFGVSGYSSEISARPPEPTFLRGDANRDGKLDISDPIYTLGFLFLGNPVDLSCTDAADVDDSGAVGIADAIFTFQYLFYPEVNTQRIPLPFPEASIDPTPDSLDCKL